MRAWQLKVLILLIVALAGAASQGPASGSERSVALGVASAPASVAPAFTFAAGGDLGANSNTDASLAVLDQSGASFYLALGDLDYDEIHKDDAWCDYVKQRLPALGQEFPFQLVSGNHEEQGGPDGYILNHAACLPDRLGSTGIYGAQYYFDFPAASPLIRVIMIAPSLQVANVDYRYEVGDADYQWLSTTIDGARAAGVGWIAVGMHKVCLTAGVKPCEIGSDLMNLLVDKKVDLVLQGHDHNYQRSKQLALSTACAAIAPGAYNGNCVVDDGADSAYVKGAGTIFVISGSVGRCCTAIDGSDPEAAYFARADHSSNGFVKYAVSASGIDAQFAASTGVFSDAFAIVADDADGDGDGFTDAVEAYAGTDPSDPCGHTGNGPSDTWTADLNTQAISGNRVNITDLSAYLAPVRRFGTAAGQVGYLVRWDMNADEVLDLRDLGELITLRPPMLGGVRAFNGPTCVS